jgi:hypothetical protein
MLVVFSETSTDAQLGTSGITTLAPNGLWPEEASSRTVSESFVMSMSNVGCAMIQKGGRLGAFERRRFGPIVRRHARSAWAKAVSWSFP